MERNLQKTVRSYHQAPEAKTLFWEQSPIGAFKHNPSKNLENAIKKISGGGQNLKNHWPYSWQFAAMDLHHRISAETTESFRTTFSKNTFVFHFRVLEAFYYIIFKNGYTFLYFLRVCGNVVSNLSLIEISVYRLS